MAMVIPAAEEDFGKIRALLQRSGLPTSDLDSTRPDFAVIREHGEVIAAGALQPLGSSALLRSVVVCPNHRHRGLGQTVVRALERAARAAGIRQLVLLTETASDFFAYLDYRVIERSSAPDALQETEEFRTLCPSSATCMAKLLTGHG